jgi:putative RecB family exonuclease
MPQPRAKASPKEKLPRKPEFSPTRIRAFLTCQMMYRLDYIDKVGRFYHTSRAGFSFGSTLHQTLQTFHEEGGPAAIPVDELLVQLASDWRSHGYESATQEQEDRAAAVQILETYHAQQLNRVDLTRTFLTEKKLKYDMGAFILTGRVDRIDEHVHDGSLEIIDYKSGRLEVSEDDVKSALAMSIYQLLAKRMYPDRNVSATIHALRGGVSATTSYTDEELNLLEDDLRGIGLLILETDFESVTPQLIDHCEHCDFLRACRGYWRSQEQTNNNSFDVI